MIVFIFDPMYSKTENQKFAQYSVKNRDSDSDFETETIEISSYWTICGHQAQWELRTSWEFEIKNYECSAVSSHLLASQGGETECYDFVGIGTKFNQ